MRGHIPYGFQDDGTFIAKDFIKNLPKTVPLKDQDGKLIGEAEVTVGDDGWYIAVEWPLPDDPRGQKDE